MAIDIEQLRKRKWPVPGFPIGQEVQGKKEGDDDSEVVMYDDMGKQVIPKKEYKYEKHINPKNYLQSCYVPEERLRAVPLDGIPPRECGITGLARDSKGSIFGVTSGDKAHLFMYRPGTEVAEEIGTIQDHCLARCALSGDKIFIGTDSDTEGYIFCYDPRDSSQAIKRISCPKKGEGIAAWVSDPGSGNLYGLTSRSGTFFVFRPDTGEVELKGEVDKDSIFSPVLAAVPNGDVFGSARWGHLFCYSKDEHRIISLQAAAPLICGREMYNSLDAMVFDEKKEVLYGGTSADGILFQFDIKTHQVRSFGKPLNQSHIRCLEIGDDGCVYGIAGKNSCHLFRYDPAISDMRDLGIFYVSKPRCWYGYEFDAAIAGNDGTIYFGENDRISHLFIYTTTKTR